MNIHELIEWLEDQPDKDVQVLIAVPDGWFSICAADSKVEEMQGERYMMLKPCYGHGDEAIEFDIRGDDFEIINN